MLLSELKIVSQPRQLSEKQVRLQEVKSIQEHMDRYLERDATNNGDVSFYRGAYR